MIDGSVVGSSGSCKSCGIHQRDRAHFSGGTSRCGCLLCCSFSGGWGDCLWRGQAGEESRAPEKDLAGLKDQLWFWWPQIRWSWLLAWPLAVGGWGFPVKGCPKAEDSGGLQASIAGSSGGPGEGGCGVLYKLVSAFQKKLKISIYPSTKSSF